VETTPVRAILSLLAVAALAACAALPRADSVRAGDTPLQVRERLGAPAATRTLPDGRTAWFYVTGPSGFETWRVVFGPNGAVAEYAQVLTAANFEWMREGATREAVLDRVGPPMERMDFWRTGTEAWTYRWRFGTFEMIGQPVFDAPSGVVKYVGIFRDPAFSSQPSGGVR
jgi:outer membrane protein assembly factor BamE (lipoprotein component of BamABCDE complex)